MFALVTAFVWGGVPFIEKMGLARLSPFAGVFVRWPAVVLGSLLLLAARPEILPVSWAC